MSNAAIRHIISLFMCPGYLNVIVDAHIIVDISEITCVNEGELFLTVIHAITVSLFNISRFNVNNEL